MGIYRAANLLIRQNGDGADLMLDQDDRDGQLVWMRIRWAEAALQAPPKGKPHEGAMNWHRWLAALLILLALGGCAATGAGQTGYTPYSHDDHSDLRGSGGEGGGSGM